MDDVDSTEVSTQRPWKVTAAVGAVATAAALALLVGGIAGLAQHTAETWWHAQGLDAYGEQDLYSLPLHTLSMVGIGMLAVVFATILVTNRRRTLAAATLIGTVFGPMTLVAAPVSESLIRDDSMDTTRGWHVAIGSLLLAVLTASTWWASRIIESKDAPFKRSHSDNPQPPITSTSLFAIVAGVCLTAQVPVMGNPERPQLLVATGWSLLIAGSAVAGTSLNRKQIALATTSCAAVLLAMASAYIRVGGWPGVAGWEFKGMQSPVILTFVTATGLVAGPLLGYLTTIPGRQRTPAAPPVPAPGFSA